MEIYRVLPDKCFHFIGAFGTHIIPLKPAGDYAAGNDDNPSGLTDKETELRQIHGIVECIAARHTADDVVYYFDGRALRRVSHEKAAMLMRKYTRQIRSAWAMESEG